MKGKENQGHIGRGSTFGGGTQRRRLQTKGVILRELEDVHRSLFLGLPTFFSRNDKVYVFRLMCCLDGIYPHTETGDQESRIRQKNGDLMPLLKLNGLCRSCPNHFLFMSNFLFCFLLATPPESELRSKSSKFLHSAYSRKLSVFLLYKITQILFKEFLV